MKQYLSILFLLTFNTCFSQTKLDTLFTQFQQTNYSSVRKAKDSIVNYQWEAIPKIIELLKDTTYVKLQNTADLIYPGAEKFYGHGGIVHYDIDWISVRAAWLLEEITFQDFGYRDLTITEEKLLNLHQQNYTSYLKTGSQDIDFKDKTPRDQLILYRLMLADSVSQWWEQNKTTWTRFSALKEALTSTDEQRQELAIHFMRFGETYCDGLSVETYKTELEPLVYAIKKSKNANAVQAQYLLDDEEYYWLEGR